MKESNEKILSIFKLLKYSIVSGHVIVCTEWFISMHYTNALFPFRKSPRPERRDLTLTQFQECGIIRQHPRGYVMRHPQLIRSYPRDTLLNGVGCVGNGNLRGAGI